MRAIIFDMDGVLADSHASHIRAWNGLLRVFNRQLTESDIELLCDGRKKEELMRSLLGDLSEDDIQAYGRQKDRLFEEEVPNITAMPGVEMFLQELRQAAVPVALASSASLARVHRTLASLGLKSYFHTIVTGADVTAGKTSPEIYCKAAQRLGAESIDVLVFEDSISGIRSATAAGMKCVGIAGSERAPALLRAGAIAAVPDFIGLSYERACQFFESKKTDYETCSSAGAIGQPPVSVLEDR